MIEEVVLSSSPCFEANSALSWLNRVNYVFGPNGSGKTTISQVLAGGSAGTQAQVRWQRNEAKNIRVYNRDYMRDVFSAPEGLPGVFLLGKASQDTYNRIEQLKTERANKAGYLRSKRQALGSEDPQLGRLGALRDELESFQEVAWRKREEVPEMILKRMPGARSSKAKLTQNVLEAAGKHDDADEDFVELEREAKTVFDQSATPVAPLPPLPISLPEQSRMKALLAQPVLGSGDVPIAELIHKLRIDDWVKEGREYLRQSEGSCPFCQETAPEGLEEALETYFDDDYEAQRQELHHYWTSVSTAMQQLEDYLAAHQEVLDLHARQNVGSMVEQVRLKLNNAKGILSQKLDHLSQKFDLEDLTPAMNSLRAVVDEANESIDIQRRILANQAQAREQLIERSWRTFARGSLSREVYNFLVQKKSIEASIQALAQDISRTEHELSQIDNELRDLRDQIASSEQAIRHINKMLSDVKFHSFWLEKSDVLKDGYVLCRASGRRADMDTLSEGERTFITFLYFFHALSGEPLDDESADLVAVIDDPISSLDSDIMFVISSLLRDLANKVERNEHRVSQLILLTHNTYFHNELTYTLDGEKTTTRHYYRIQKRAPEPNRIEYHAGRNPVRSLYLNLWDEIAEAKSSPEKEFPGLPNTMRRIFESFLKIMGGIDLSALEDRFPVEDRPLCRSLLAWAHKGSHAVVDSIDYSQSATSAATWLDVFEKCFKYSGYPMHYNVMMMRAQGGRE